MKAPRKHPRSEEKDDVAEPVAKTAKKAKKAKK